MSLWSHLAELADRFLNVKGARPVDLSLLDRKLSPTAPSNAGCRGASLRNEPNADSIEVLPEYKFVLESIKAGAAAIFVTGRAGTGKSTLIRFLSQSLKNCAVVAPTALAAVNVQGTTVHSFFGFPHRPLNPEEVFLPRNSMVPVVESLGTLIVDEVSMVTPDLVDSINNALKKVRRDDRPFGGVSVVFVGDLLQLPPVVSDPAVAKFFTDRYRTPFFFSAEIFAKVKIVPVELTRVFRQNARDFIALLDRIRLNDSHRDAVARLNRECFRDRKSGASAALHLVPTNAAAGAINRVKLNAISSPLCVSEAVVEGRLDPQKDRFQAPYRLELKVGAQIIFVKNNKPYWLNGTVGQITSIDVNTLRVEIAGTKNVVTVDRQRWDKVRYQYDSAEKRITSDIVGSFVQFPLNLGWAITIHKSQGMTLDSVRIDLGNGAFCAGQTYVALSRCRTLQGIALDRPLKMGDVKADPTILSFYAHLNPMRNQSADLPLTT